MMLRSHFQRGYRQQGLSIVELMVSLLLSSMLLLGVLQVFDTNKQTSQVTTALARVQESGRMAMEMLSRDIRRADFWGCIRDTGEFENHLDSSHEDYDDWMNFVNAEGIDGENDVTSRVIGAKTVKDGTDVLHLSGARRPNLKLVHSVPANAANIQVTSGIDIPQGSIIMISDCTAADIFGNTHANTDGGGIIGHNTGNAGGGLNEEKDLSKSYTGSAQILLPYRTSYFIAEAESGVWSLFREHNNEVAELVRDVENMQVQYGVDSNADGSVDAFEDASSADMDSVLSIRVAVTVNSANTAPGDTVTRRYSVTGNIRNRTL